MMGGAGKVVVRALRELATGGNVIRAVTGTNKVLHLGNPGCEFIDGAVRRGAARSPLVTTLFTYAQRLAGAVPSGGAVLAPAEVAHVVRGDLDYLVKLGLAAKDIRVIAVRGEKAVPLVDLALADVEGIRRQLGDLQGGVLFPFIGSRKASLLARRLGMRPMPRNIRAVNLINNKGFTLQELQRLGVNVPYGHWVRGCGFDGAKSPFLDVLSKSTEQGSGAVYVKLSRAVSGEGVTLVRSLDEFQALLAREPKYLDQLAHQRLGLRIDAAVDAVEFPNVMVWVGNRPEEDRFIYASMQTLVGAIHAGNTGPLTGRLKDELMPSVQTTVAWLRSVGFRNGLAGIDFAIDQRTRVAYGLEVNGRSNGNNVAGFIVHALEDAARPKVWVANNAVRVPEGTTREQFVDFLTEQQLHFNTVSGEGVFVVNSGTGAKGVMQVGAGANSFDHARTLLEGAAKMAAMLVLGDLAGLFYEQAA